MSTATHEEAPVELALAGAAIKTPTTTKENDPMQDSNVEAEHAEIVAWLGRLATAREGAATPIASRDDDRFEALADAGYELPEGDEWGERTATRLALLYWARLSENPALKWPQVGPLRTPDWAEYSLLDLELWPSISITHHRNLGGDDSMKQRVFLLALADGTGPAGIDDVHDVTVDFATEGAAAFVMLDEAEQVAGTMAEALTRHEGMTTGRWITRDAEECWSTSCEFETGDAGTVTAVLTVVSGTIAETRVLIDADGLDDLTPAQARRRAMAELAAADAVGREARRRRPYIGPGHALRGLRERADLTIDELAEMLAWKPVKIKRMEHGWPFTPTEAAEVSACLANVIWRQGQRGPDEHEALAADAAARRLLADMPGSPSHPWLLIQAAAHTGLPVGRIGEAVAAGRVENVAERGEVWRVDSREALRWAEAETARASAIAAGVGVTE